MACLQRTGTIQFHTNQPLELLKTAVVPDLDRVRRDIQSSCDLRIVLVFHQPHNHYRTGTGQKASYTFVAHAGEFLPNHDLLRSELPVSRGILELRSLSNRLIIQGEWLNFPFADYEKAFVFRDAH